MKVIIIYSGKGGVGKTTTTANIAKTLVEQGKKVFILDADVNTPSMPVIFENQNPNELLFIASLGYSTSKTIYVTDSAIRSYISEAIISINSFKPDYVLIDTPPSITDVHINLLQKIKPSGLIVVTQPNALSVTDLNRTALFFKDNGVNILGVVENMCTKVVEGAYSWKVLASIPFDADFNFENVYNKNKELYSQIATNLDNLDSVVLENKKRQLFDETITFDDIRQMPMKGRSSLKFVNLSTWEDVKELIEESEIGRPDAALMYLDTKCIGKMLKPFETDDQAYFMVTKSPSCEIKLITGEIGVGTLTVADSHYGVPRIKYQTSQGEIVLFPYEIIPISAQELINYTGEYGYLPTKDGRYLPPKNEVQEVYYAFGSRVGLFDNWEDVYDNIASGNLPKVSENQSMVAMQSVTKGERKRRKDRTIGDMEYNLKQGGSKFL